MKKLLLLALCGSLLIFATNSYAESDEICCTWVNTNYTSANPPQKVIFNFDGTFASYKTKNTSDALKRGMYLIAKKWQDSEGNIWYQIKMLDPKSGTRYKLAKISDDGKILEFVCKTDKYPADISSKDTAYCKYTQY
jgi:hypothetical protein